MKKVVFLMIVVVLLVTLIAAIPAFAGRPVHSVHAGGPDACYPGQPGCDANFSLSAKERPDGSVAGQWTDQFGGGSGGFHIVIDCLSVNGNDAWVSGILTHETLSGDGSYVGLRAATRVRDNGTSANDPPDQISFSWPEDDDFNCLDEPDYPLFDAPQGQVKVK